MTRLQMQGPSKRPRSGLSVPHEFNITVLILSGVLALVGCGGGGGGNDQPNKNVTSIKIAPVNPSIVVGSQQQFTATAVFDDGSQQDVTSSATWTSADTTKAKIGNSGLATTMDIGRPQITATYSSFSATTRLTIVIGSTLPVARFAYGGRGTFNGFSSYVVDDATGLLRPTGNFEPLSGPCELCPPYLIGPLVDPRGKFLYLSYTGTFFVYSIDPASGIPSPVQGSPFSPADGPRGLGGNSFVLDPSGLYAYLYENDNNQLFAFDVDPQTGAITTVLQNLSAPQGGPLTIEPFGRFLYSGNLVFAIDPSTGKLTQTSSLTAELSSLTISPDGKFAFGVSDYCTSKIAGFNVDPTTGALTEVAGSPFVAGVGTYGLALDPSGKFLYTAQAGSCDSQSVPGAVSVFSIGASGTLTPVGSGLSLPNPAYYIQIDPSGKFAYVATDVASNRINVLSIGAGQQLTLIGGTFGGGPVLSSGVTPVTYTPQSVYAVDSGSNDVSTYGIDGSTGALTLQGTAATGSGPKAIAVTSQRQFAFVANQNSNNVSIYTVNSSGALSSVGTVAAGTGPDSLIVDLNSSSLYVANSTSDDLSAFFIDSSTGALTPMVGPFAVGKMPSAVTSDAARSSLLVSNAGSDDVSLFYLTAEVGYPTPMVPSSSLVLPPGSAPVFVAYEPSGRFFYVCSQTNQISTYSGLALVTTITAGTQPTAITFDPTGRFAYIVDAGANGVLTYAINASNGSLTATGTVATGTQPASITVEPSGKFVYVANQGSNDLSIYSADPNTGMLTPVGTAPAGAQPVSVTATATMK